MNRCLLTFSLLALLTISSSLANAQQTTPTRPVSYPRQARVVNIFGLPQDAPATQEPATSGQKAPATDPFSDLPPLEPAQPLTPNAKDPFQKGTTTPELNDMPVDVDPYAAVPQQEPGALESLPAPRQPAPGPTGQTHLPPSNWMNMAAVAQPQTHSSPNLGRPTTSGMRTASFRRPSPATPTINTLQPAFFQVPVNIRVIPTYVGYPYGYPGYLGHPFYPPARPVPAIPDYYYGPEPKGSANATGYGQQFNPAYHRATDQPLNYNRDPNLVGTPSHSVNYTGYPLNYLSYPANNHYGLHFQSFPTTRRLDR